MTEPWERLAEELDSWRDEGRTATFWWRDDDAAETHPNLSRLLRTAGDRPISLAAVPARLDVALAEHLALGRETVSVLPHGFLHENHAPEGEKKAEFGPHRPPEVMIAEIGAGWGRLRALLEGRALPIFVPPWNRIDPALVERLPETGLEALSTYKARGVGEGATRLNTHVDIVDWKAGGGFLGDERVIDLTAGHLKARRTASGGVDPTEPTGLLTHHLVHDEACWTFIDRLLSVLDDHPAARIVPAAQGLSEGERA